MTMRKGENKNKKGKIGMQSKREKKNSKTERENSYSKGKRSKNNN